MGCLVIGTFSDGMFSDGAFSGGMFSDEAFSGGTFCMWFFFFVYFMLLSR